MSRVAPWKKKKSAHWLATREKLSSTTFYLVNRMGPTVFSVRDDALITYKITLGNPHACTCDRLETDELCIHQLYCLSKVLRISDDHPLVYQLGFTDPEAEQVLSGQCGDVTRAHAGVENRSATARARRKARQKADADPDSPIRNSEFVDRQLLSEAGDGEEDLCPICQDAMNKDQALTWCRKGCGNNIHAKCMQTFAQYKISSHAQVECPLCRSEWNIELLKDDVRGKATLKNSCAPIYCSQCTMPVRTGIFHRCVQCSQRRALQALREDRRAILEGVTTVPHSTTSSLFSNMGTGTGSNIGTSSGRGPIERRNIGLVVPTVLLTDAAQFREQAKELAALAAERAESRASSAASGKRCVDFCERCFRHALGKEHTVHHFICSNASTSVEDDVEWEVSKNPLLSDQTHDAAVQLYTAHNLNSASDGRASSAGPSALRPELRALQEREITVDDYAILLELDEVHVQSVTEHLAAALPKAEGVPATGAIDVNISLSPNRSAAAAAAAAAGKLCWCKVSPEVATGMHISTLSKAKLRALPCGHVAHDYCVQTGLDHAKNTEAIPYVRFRCRHDGCRATIFPGLFRSRKKRKKEKTSTVSSSSQLPSSNTAAPIISGGLQTIGSGLSVNGISSHLGGVQRMSVHPEATQSTLSAQVRSSNLQTGEFHAVLTNSSTASALSAGLRDGMPSVLRAQSSVASLGSVASSSSLSGASLGNERPYGRSHGGLLVKGRPRQKFDGRVSTPPKPSYSDGDVNNPANPARGRQRFHLSSLAPAGTLHAPSSAGRRSRTSPAPTSLPDAQDMQGALTVSRVVTPIERPPAIPIGNQPESRSALRQQSLDMSNGTEGGGGRAAALTVAGQSTTTQYPQRLVRLLRTTSGAAERQHANLNNNTIHSTSTASIGIALHQTNGTQSAIKRSGKIAKSSLSRPHADRAITEAPIDMLCGLPSISSTQLQFRSRAQLSEHLQPSGMSLSTQQDQFQISERVRLSTSPGMGVLGGLGWTAGHRAGETEEYDDV